MSKELENKQESKTICGVIRCKYNSKNYCIAELRIIQAQTTEAIPVCQTFESKD